MTKPISLIVTSLLLSQVCLGWTPINSNTISRRDAFGSAAAAAAAAGASVLAPPIIPAFAEDDPYRFEKRDRNGNKDAAIKEDFWFTTGATPPRRLNSPLVLDDPKWNSFGSCETTGADGATTNSCTYISLKQRQPAYSKYSFTIIQGAKEFQQLRGLLAAQEWNRAARNVFVNAETNLPPPTVDAILKMVLFGSAMLTSPNYSGPAKDLLVARFYVNEYKFAISEIGRAIVAKDQARALAAWDFGKDSYNSYIQIVNRQIVPKVGDKLTPIE